MALARSLLALLALAVLGCVAQPPSDHTNNWAVLVCSSRFWFNYRHMANTLGMYRTVKRLGIPDSQIILMLADDVACSPRNSFPATVYANADRQLDLYGDNIEVDYRGYEVSVESFMRLLTGRQPATTPRSQRLLTDDKSNIFIYMTGHGGDEFLKFQDNEEISAHDVADAIEQMAEKRRYNELLLMFDTCEAQTMYSKVRSPNVLAAASSRLDEKSYSHHGDPAIGIHVIDKYTHHVLEFMEGVNKTSTATFADLFATFTLDKIGSHHGVRTDLFPHDLSDVLLTDFFGGVASVDVDRAPAASAGIVEEATLESLPVMAGLDRLDDDSPAHPGPKTRSSRRRSSAWQSWDRPSIERNQRWTVGGMGWAAGGAVVLGLAGWSVVR